MTRTNREMIVAVSALSYVILKDTRGEDAQRSIDGVESPGHLKTLFFSASFTNDSMSFFEIPINKSACRFHFCMHLKYQAHCVHLKYQAHRVLGGWDMLPSFSSGWYQSNTNRTRGNVKKGEVVAQRLITVEPDKAGSWEDVKRARRMMAERRQEFESNLRQGYNLENSKQYLSLGQQG